MKTQNNTINPLLVQAHPFTFFIEGKVISFVLPHNPVEMIKLVQILSDKLNRRVGLQEVTNNLFGSPSTFLAFVRAMKGQREGVN
jgi:hypothetical protein